MILNKGDRIELVEMDDPDPIPPGTKGTVVYTMYHVPVHESAWTQVDVDWDNGRTLMLSVPPDHYHKI